MSRLVHVSEWRNLLIILVSVWYIHDNIKNHNSLDCESSLGLDIKQSPSPQDMFRSIIGLISWVIRSVGVLRH